MLLMGHTNAMATRLSFQYAQVMVLKVLYVP